MASAAINATAGRVAGERGPRHCLLPYSNWQGTRPAQVGNTTHAACVDSPLRPPMCRACGAHRPFAHPRSQRRRILLDLPRILVIMYIDAELTGRPARPLRPGSPRRGPEASAGMYPPAGWRQVSAPTCHCRYYSATGTSALKADTKGILYGSGRPRGRHKGVPRRRGRRKEPVPRDQGQGTDCSRGPPPAAASRPRYG